LSGSVPAKRCPDRPNTAPARRAGIVAYLIAIAAMPGAVFGVLRYDPVAFTPRSAESFEHRADGGHAGGALSMAAGEYVSVSSQADTEAADLARERGELATQPDAELAELTQIYVDRGLTEDLAREVAQQLTERDAFAAHARDELSISSVTTARPLQAALASAATFTAGAALPLIAV